MNWWNSLSVSRCCVCVLCYSWQCVCVLCYSWSGGKPLNQCMATGNTQSHFAMEGESSRQIIYKLPLSMLSKLWTWKLFYKIISQEKKVFWIYSVCYFHIMNCVFYSDCYFYIFMFILFIRKPYIDWRSDL